MLGIYHTKKKPNRLDGLNKKERKLENPDWPLARFLIRRKKTSYWLKGSVPIKDFIARSSKLYLTQEELNELRKKGKAPRSFSRIDSVASTRPLRSTTSLEKNSSSPLKKQFKLAAFRSYILNLFSGYIRNMNLARAWNVSLVGSIVLGMFLMGVIYHYLGQGAFAKTQELELTNRELDGLVLGESDTKQGMNTEAEASFITELLKEYGNQEEEANDSIMEDKIKEMTKGYPIEKMAAEISRKDKIVAAFLIGIAKKESGWGVHVPLLKGQDCYNYWGYRGQRKRMGTGGHTCFDSPKDAIDTVSKRIEFLIYNEKRNTPGKMVEVWKCGYDCSWDNPKNVKKWVSDVDMYFREIDKN